MPSPNQTSKATEAAPESWRRDTLKSLQLITSALAEQNDRQARSNERIGAYIEARGIRVAAK